MNSRQVRLLNSKATGLIGTTPGITRNWNYLLATCYSCLLWPLSKRALTKHPAPPSPQPPRKQSENRIPADVQALMWCGGIVQLGFVNICLHVSNQYNNSAAFTCSSSSHTSVFIYNNITTLFSSIKQSHVYMAHTKTIIMMSKLFSFKHDTLDAYEIRLIVVLLPVIGNVELLTESMSRKPSQQQRDLCVWSQNPEWQLLINLHAVHSQRNKKFPCQILVMFCCLTFRDIAETVRNWIVNWIIVILAGLKPLSR